MNKIADWNTQTITWGEDTITMPAELTDKLDAILWTAAWQYDETVAQYAKELAGLRSAVERDLASLEKGQDPWGTESHAATVAEYRTRMRAEARHLQTLVYLHKNR
jgi:hypothetical protein